MDSKQSATSENSFLLFCIGRKSALEIAVAVDTEEEFVGVNFNGRSSRRRYDSRHCVLVDLSLL